jgi:hypothetical protein
MRKNGPPWLWQNVSHTFPLAVVIADVASTWAAGSPAGDRLQPTRIAHSARQPDNITVFKI